MPHRLIETLRGFCTEKGIGELWTNFIIFMVMLSLTTTFHETIHIVTAQFLGCKGDLIDMSIITGLSAIDCDNSEDVNSKMIIVALSAPIVLWITGCWLWFLRGKDSLLRVWSLLCWFYGSIPSLSFWVAKSDAHFAMEHGLPLLWAFLIFAIPTSIVAVLISREITNEEEEWT